MQFVMMFVYTFDFIRGSGLIQLAQAAALCKEGGGFAAEVLDGGGVGIDDGGL